MKTKNLYHSPLDSGNIIRRDTSSPAHRGRLKYAVDFLCNEGTEVLAALNGEVVESVCNKIDGGSNESMDNAGNYVLLKHEKGEFSHYAHLKFNRVVVKKGEAVKTGDLLGYSGNTGFSFGPHLHFSVIKFKGVGLDDFESLEIQWEK